MLGTGGWRLEAGGWGGAHSHCNSVRIQNSVNEKEGKGFDQLGGSCRGLQNRQPGNKVMSLEDFVCSEIPEELEGASFSKLLFKLHNCLNLNWNVEGKAVGANR